MERVTAVPAPSRRSLRRVAARFAGAPLAVVLLSLLPVRAPAAPAPPPTLVRVERVRPRHEKIATLRFLKDNRDFLRGRLDRMREKPETAGAQARDIDPRFLAYQGMIRDALAARDSLAVIADDRRRQDLFTSVTELGRLEAQLDEMERLLAEQRSRLGILQADFTGRQQTALAIVVRGWPVDATVATIALTLENGATLSIPVTDEERESLRHGGILQVFHGLVEPREQVIQLSFTGDRWPADDAGYLELDPTRDQLTFLQLDLSTVRLAQGASGISASRWLQDSRLSANEGTETRP